MANVVQTTSTAPFHLFADEYPVQTLAGIYTGADIDAHVALTRDAAGKWVVAGLTDVIEGVSVAAVAASGADVTAPVYVSGSFNMDVISFNAGLTTAAAINALAVATLFFKELN